MPLCFSSPSDQLNQPTQSPIRWHGTFPLPCFSSCHPPPSTFFLPTSHHLPILCPFTGSAQLYLPQKAHHGHFPFQVGVNDAPPCTAVALCLHLCLGVKFGDRCRGDPCPLRVSFFKISHLSSDRPCHLGTCTPTRTF